jgi:hypothetical protein
MSFKVGPLILQENVNLERKSLTFCSLVPPPPCAFYSLHPHFLKIVLEAWP